jgi:hypothetical protein
MDMEVKDNQINSKCLSSWFSEIVSTLKTFLEGKSVLFSTMIITTIFVISIVRKLHITFSSIVSLLSHIGITLGSLSRLL